MLDQELTVLNSSSVLLTLLGWMESTLSSDRLLVSPVGPAVMEDFLLRDTKQYLTSCLAHISAVDTLSYFENK